MNFSAGCGLQRPFSAGWPSSTLAQEAGWRLSQQARQWCKNKKEKVKESIGDYCYTDSTLVAITTQASGHEFDYGGKWVLIPMAQCFQEGQIKIMVKMKLESSFHDSEILRIVCTFKRSTILRW